MNRRKVFERLYNDTCDVYEYKDAKNESNTTKQDWALVYPKIKCKLSKKTLNNVNQTNGEATASDARVLFMDDIVLVLKGSKIVCRGEVLYAGKPFIYPESHQEIPLLYTEMA